MKQKDLLVFVAPGFEDTELITALDIFSRGELTYDLVSPENLTQIRGKYNAIVETKPLVSIDHRNYRGVYLPGGVAYRVFNDSKAVKDIINTYYKENKIVSAICAAPEVLMSAGILKNHKYTANSGYAVSANNTGHEVEKDKNILTGRDFRATLALADEVVKQFKTLATK